jgi:hypothetical protein
MAGWEGTTGVSGQGVPSDVKRRSWLKVVSKSCSLLVVLIDLFGPGG